MDGLCLPPFVEKATELGSPDITLTAFELIPWNVPFYEKMGFTAIPLASLDADLICILEKERNEGLSNRVAMIFKL